MADYVKSFVIGSSAFVDWPFYPGVYKSPEDRRTYTYYGYTYMNPAYFGLLNMLSRWAQLTFGLSLQVRMILICIISIVIILTMSRIFEVYDFTPQQQTKYDFGIIAKHMFAWLIIINGLERII